ncbi:MAG: NADH:ubiquinone reductase (Na(+)-transporting) subunit B [Acidobacteriota bacterium]
MQFLRNILDKQHKLFEPGGKLEKLYAFYEAGDTFLFSPGKVTKGAAHVRDAVDLKRLMITVVIALLPAVFMAMYNTGLQAHRAISGGALPLENWQTAAMGWLGLPFAPDNFIACMTHGALYFVPVLLVTFIIGGHAEALFAVARKHEINEGFLVTGFLFPLTLPPTIPYWQVALGILFGVIIGKEIFGGTGMNILNVALTARAFLFFAYPVQISGDKVWIAAQTSPDGYTGATYLAMAAEGGMKEVTEVGMTTDWMSAFLGLVPGSMGETSALACLIGLVVLMVTRVASWRIVTGVFLGTIAASMLLNAIPVQDNLFLEMPFWWHMVLGGWAFGAVFMATDPVTAAHSSMGRWIYGLLIGVMAVFIRVLNPAYPEGVMLAILLLNVFAALIDHYVVQANVRRRRTRYAV